MKCQYQSRNGRFVFEFEGSGHKEIFESIASVQEVFESDESCGLCSGNNLRFVVRTAKKDSKEYTYFELRCQDCGARFEFGQSQDMKSLFPKRNRDAQGNETEDRYLSNRGWYKYSPNSAPEDPHYTPDELDDSERYGPQVLDRPAQRLRDAKVQDRTAAATPAKCPECNATGKYHSPTCSLAAVTGASAA